MKVPDSGPSIEGLDMSNIATMSVQIQKNDCKMVLRSRRILRIPLNVWEFLRQSGKSLAGVGAQYDSELVYHNVRKEVEEQGVVYTDMSALTGPYAEMVRKHFMKLVKPTDHKFAALHGAVWSRGSFVYVPPHVSVEIPLQSYFRLNAPRRRTV